MTPSEYDQFDAQLDSPKRDEIRERSKNVTNVNPEPTPVAPVKSQAAAGDQRVQDLVDAGHAVVDPAAGQTQSVVGSPSREQATVTPEDQGAEQRTSSSSSSSGSKSKGD